jgi:hypothetical protein
MIRLEALVLLALIGMTAACGLDEHGKKSAPDHAPVPARPSWPGAIYLEVRAYHSREPFLRSFENGIPEQVDDKEGVLLNQDQERRLIAAVTANTKPYITADCWAPRNAFVFWDPLGKPVAEIDICFDCLQVQGGPSDSPDILALADLVNDLGLPLGTGFDTKAFRKAFESNQERYPNGR